MGGEKKSEEGGVRQEGIDGELVFDHEKDSSMEFQRHEYDAQTEKAKEERMERQNEENEEKKADETAAKETQQAMDAEVKQEEKVEMKVHETDTSKDAESAESWQPKELNNEKTQLAKQAKQAEQETDLKLKTERKAREKEFQPLKAKSPGTLFVAAPDSRFLSAEDTAKQAKLLKKLRRISKAMPSESSGPVSLPPADAAIARVATPFHCAKGSSRLQAGSPGAITSRRSKAEKLKESKMLFHQLVQQACFQQLRPVASPSRAQSLRAR